jgi:RimJ/RimL family protein N-acetyltransferase
VVARCWEPRDAPLLKGAVDSSLEDLRQWMPWADNEPQALEEKVQLLRRFRGQFDLGEDFVYGLFSSDELEVIGGSGLHTRVGEGAFEIGYWIRSSRAGQGLATEVTAALTRIGFEVCEVDRIEIHCEPANERSTRIPRKLGYAEEARLRRRLYAPPGGEPRDVVVFSLFHDAYVGTPGASAELEAFDAAGRRVLPA